MASPEVPDPRGLTARVFAFPEPRRGTLLDDHEPLLERVGVGLRRCAWPQNGETLVVAVSGGPDSVALLDVLTRLAPGIGISLHVAHVDHQLRPDSAEDARFVASLARRLGVPATVESADVAGFARTRRLGIEEAARTLRYDLFARVVEETEAAGVALGHTADDQVETTLLALVRGTGPSGLRGMRVLSERHVEGSPRPLWILRPLLAVTRAEIEDYLLARGIEPRRDPTNDETEFRRNRIRHRILPALRQLNPAVDSAILRLGRLADEDEAYFEARVAELWPSVADAGESSVKLRRDDLGRLPPSLTSRLLRSAFAALVGDSRELEAGHVGAAQALLASGRTGGALDWPRGVRVRLGYEWLSLERAEVADAGPPPLESVELAVPGTTCLSTGSRIVATLTPATLTERPCRWEYTGHDHADLDHDLVGASPLVRRRVPGDRIVPLGMRGEKKVQDLLVDAKIPRAERDRVPVVQGPSGIVWVAGVRVDERYRVTEATRAVLCLRLVGREEPDSPQR